MVNIDGGTAVEGDQNEDEETNWKREDIIIRFRWGNVGNCDKWIIKRL